MQRISITLWILLLIPVLAAGLGAWFHPGGDWLALILQASWSPPVWLFVVGWPVYFLSQSLSACLVWLSDRPGRGLALLAWAVQWIAYLAWSWVFFSLHRPGWAMLAVAGCLALAVLCHRLFRNLSSPAALLILPCMAWLALLLVWNLAVWRFSGGGLDTLF